MRDEKQPAVYILAGGPRGTIYVGVTSALWNRVATHKQGEVAGFTAKYGLNSLVWYEHHISMDAAIRREKQIKKWNRDWKVGMIETLNPTWIDLHDDIDPARYYDEKTLDSRLRGNDGKREKEVKFNEPQ
jgi:putative endonuclease